MQNVTRADDDTAFDDFHAELSRCTRQAVCGREYVLVRDLKKWLTDRAEPDGLVTQAGRLLMAAYASHTRFMPVTSTQISTGADCSLLVFSILLKLGVGHLIDQFQKLDFVDNQIPITRYTLQTELSNRTHLPNVEKLAIQFDEAQWQFCPAQFDLAVYKEHYEKRVIPICQKRPIGKGGTAEVWEISVQEHFVGREIQKMAQSSRFNDPNDNFGDRYLFALKTYKEGNMSLFENEKNAFLGLRQQEGIVQYLASYSHEEMKPPSSLAGSSQHGEVEQIAMVTHNILLEYGELDLEEFFARRLPPIHQFEVEEFWKALFEVADALEGVHNLKTHAEGGIQEYHGWHADIKPANILSVQGKFKLADPGFATFVPKKEEFPREFVHGGTETYGAPERHPDRRGTVVPVTQTIDSWSLGCVFSMAATWVILGREGIRQFDRTRQKAIQRIVGEQHPRQTLHKHMPELTTGDYFHDGQEVLLEVGNWHNLLRNALRKGDLVTGQLLDLVDQKMLLGDPQLRIKTKAICKELKQILSRSREGPRNLIPEIIMKSLLEVESEAEERVSSATIKQLNQALTASQDRQDRKSKMIGLPIMKTTHRSEYLKSALEQMEMASSNIIYESPTEEKNNPAASNIRPSPRTPTTSERSPIYHQLVDTKASIGSLHSIQSPKLTTPHTLKRAKTSKPEAPKDVWQVREEIEKRGSLMGFKPKKDKIMTRYFHDRDIKFLVDNGATMQRWWFQTTYLLETLVLKAVGQDKNGMDLLFTSGPVKVDGKQSKSEFHNAMKNKLAQPGGHTDPRVSLGDIFQDYIKEVKRRQRQNLTAKGFTLIILTDGIWEGVKDKMEVKKTIVAFIKELWNLIGDIKYRPVSIEFVQLGNDPDATYRLQHLDNDLKNDGLPDVIDREPATGDVNKMMLGSFVEEYDEADGSDDDDSSTIGPVEPYSRPDSEGTLNHNQAVYGAMTGTDAAFTTTPNASNFTLPTRTATGQETLQQTPPATPSARRNSKQPDHSAQRKSRLFG